ncbi:tetratricopeptide repeat protein [Pontibacter ruber]|uniref:Tetratricopeptide repeat protein n=1 Tax=Pontibacter ruber TaxID=1343895 RepID=A0ABW5CXY4_9BACT|nr:tetratricopeptide repeat protein [Pontibacter ruber]
MPEPFYTYNLYPNGHYISSASFTLANRLLHIAVILVCLLLTACSAERNNPLSKTYHNTTARYNGYFLAREKMEAIEKGIQAQVVYDYNQPLPIYPLLDSSTAKAFAADLEDVVKKASFPIQWHKNSKWVDDSYNLIGKVRYYQLNFPDAARTFKYVNSTSKDANARHEALVWLMRTFLVTGELDNAQSVSEFLKKERLNKDNARELYLARAQYHRLQGDTTAMIENLALSLPNFEEKDAESRVRFSLARLYQLQRQDKEAYQQYSRILRRNPPYDLGFFSRLYLGQVSELSDAQDKERMANHYRKLLKDSKNNEYKDKILYEMAQFELRQQNYDKALEYLNASLKSTGALPNQKAYSYLLAGKVYFEHLNKYNLAQAYYDSAVQVYPPGAIDYQQVVERRDILTDFATQFSTIQTQDSLQRLARLSEGERLQFVQQLVQREEEERLQALAMQQAKQQTQEQGRRGSLENTRRNNGGNGGNADNSGIWYFDNPAAMATARSEFVRRWGDRPLQDNWRIRSRGEATEQAPVAQQQPEAAPAEPTQSPEERMAAQVQTYLQNIPTTTAALQQSERQVEEALFKLANIYSQKLKDNTKAAETYEQLLARFPTTGHAAEAYYALYLIYDKAGDERKTAYYNKIKQQFPYSTFAQLIDDPEFLSKNAAENIKAHTLYDSAFVYYENKEYKETTRLLAQLGKEYPRNDIADKAAFLGVLVTARTEKPEALREQLQQFKAAYPASPLLPQANQLLTTYQELEQKNLLRREAPQVITALHRAEKGASLTPEEKVSTEIASATASTAAEIPLPNKQTVKDTAAAPPDTVAQKVSTKQADTTTQAAPPVVQPDTNSTTANPEIADPLAYDVSTDSAFYFVLLYPTAAPAFKDVVAKYEKYNSTYYKKQNITIDSVAFSDSQTMLVLRSFPDVKLAQSFNVKQKGPQAPIGRIRGVEFTTFVISSANFQKFKQKKDLETYLNFFRNNY